MDCLKNPKIILASASLRRHELIKELFGEFNIRVPVIAEQSVYKAPHRVVEDIAAQKAFAIDISAGELIIAADTAVYLDGVFYGKPGNLQNALKMLKVLSGRTHTVYTGVCIRSATGHICFYDKSKVTFHKLDETELLHYIKDKKPFDKAGAYGIQDGALVKGYQGSYTNIVGLPMERLRAALKGFGISK